MAAADSKASGDRAPGDEAYGHLPSKLLLMRPLEAARTQIAFNWSPTGRITCAFLGVLYSSLVALVSATLRKEPADEAALRFNAEWTRLDTEYGGVPEDRGWELASREAYARLRVIDDYLVASGLTSLSEARRDSPKDYWDPEELDR